MLRSILNIRDIIIRDQVRNALAEGISSNFNSFIYQTHDGLLIISVLHKYVPTRLPRTTFI